VWSPGRPDGSVRSSHRQRRKATSPSPAIPKSAPKRERRLREDAVAGAAEDDGRRRARAARADDLLDAGEEEAGALPALVVDVAHRDADHLGLRVADRVAHGAPSPDQVETPPVPGPAGGGDQAEASGMVSI
jgi:hypothetical protein